LNLEKIYYHDLILLLSLSNSRNNLSSKAVSGKYMGITV